MYVCSWALAGSAAFSTYWPLTLARDASHETFPPAPGLRLRHLYHGAVASGLTCLLLAAAGLRSPVRAGAPEVDGGAFSRVLQQFWVGPVEIHTCSVCERVGAISQQGNFVFHVFQTAGQPFDTVDHVADCFLEGCNLGAEVLYRCFEGVHDFL